MYLRFLEILFALCVVILLFALFSCFFALRSCSFASNDLDCHCSSLDVVVRWIVIDLHWLMFVYSVRFVLRVRSFDKGSHQLANGSISL